ncbi:MAG: hypothetical protein JXA62_05770 [Candidatus Aminicenantes bacterium]|nr:hypothetical protein [Candidatus Aminicenantes bacterium]
MLTPFGLHQPEAGLSPVILTQSIWSRITRFPNPIAKKADPERADSGNDLNAAGICDRIQPQLEIPATPQNLTYLVCFGKIHTIFVLEGERGARQS